jgi:membrane protein YdbS with pleckstrin-like domain
MRYRVRTLDVVAWVVGPTVWISSVGLMIFGLWTGAWYGYAFAFVLLVGAGSILVAIYRVRRMVKAELMMDDIDP